MPQLVTMLFSIIGLYFGVYLSHVTAQEVDEPELFFNFTEDLDVPEEDPRSYYVRDELVSFPTILIVTIMVCYGILVIFSVLSFSLYIMVAVALSRYRHEQRLQWPKIRYQLNDLYKEIQRRNEMISIHGSKSWSHLNKLSMEVQTSLEDAVECRSLLTDVHEKLVELLANNERMGLSEFYEFDNAQ